MGHHALSHMPRPQVDRLHAYLHAWRRGRRPRTRAGMAFAMVGANVVLTDTADVLPLLRINYETNLSPAAVRLARGEREGGGAGEGRGWAGATVKAEAGAEPERWRRPALTAVAPV